MHFTQRMCCEHSGTRCQKTPQGGVHVQNRVTLTAPGIPTYYYAGDFIVFMLIVYVYELQLTKIFGSTTDVVCQNMQP